MSGPNTAREAFFVQSLGEMAELANRMERLVALLNDSEQGLRDASSKLADQIAETEERMAAASQNVKNYAAQHIASHLDSTTRGAARAQADAMAAVGREVFQRELGPMLRSLTAPLQELRDTARRKTGRWDSLLTHAAAATMAAVATWLLTAWPRIG